MALARHEMSSTIPNLDEWVEMVRPHFAFLIGRGFRAVPVQVDPALAVWGPRMQYLSDSIGVQLHCSVEFDRVEAKIIRLLDAQVPKYPIFVKDGDRVHWFHLDGLLALCDPDRAVLSTALTGLDEESLQHQLAFIADALSELAGDLLDARSSTLDREQENMHEHARAHPPTIRVEVAVDASADEVAQLVSNARESFPGIDVQVHRYRR